MHILSLNQLVNKTSLAPGRVTPDICESNTCVIQTCQTHNCRDNFCFDQDCYEQDCGTFSCTQDLTCTIDCNNNACD
jgi:hypothetical protein